MPIVQWYYRALNEHFVRGRIGIRSLDLEKKKGGEMQLYLI